MNSNNRPELTHNKRHAIVQESVNEMRANMKPMDRETKTLIAALETRVAALEQLERNRAEQSRESSAWASRMLDQLKAMSRVDENRRSRIRFPAVSIIPKV